jgi:hypothetical protein
MECAIEHEHKDIVTVADGQSTVDDEDPQPDVGNNERQLFDHVIKNYTIHKTENYESAIKASIQDEYSIVSYNDSMTYLINNIGILQKKDGRIFFNVAFDNNIDYIEGIRLKDNIPGVGISIISCGVRHYVNRDMQVLLFAAPYADIKIRISFQDDTPPPEKITLLWTSHIIEPNLRRRLMMTQLTTKHTILSDGMLQFR